MSRRGSGHAGSVTTPGSTDSPAPSASARSAAVSARRVQEIETLDELDGLLASGARSMRGWRLQGLDLRAYDDRLAALDATGAAFLGCRTSPELADRLRSGGAVVLPRIEGLPFSPYRGLLYTPAELYAGLEDGYEATSDARTYRWSVDSRVEHDALLAAAAALHDHAVDDALGEALAGHRTVGVMGGHRLERGTDGYRTAIELGRRLAGRGLLVATGGGPGAMEAANLGARLVEATQGEVDAAVERLAEAPDHAGTETAWARAAAVVAADLPEVTTVGVPTWFYGHEPPNLFATHIAKFFANARREDTLLRRCDAGIVFLPGAAGTVQELFQDACENYYATEGEGAAMVLVGREHWTRTLPAWPLLQALAEQGGFAERIFLVDDADGVDAALG